MKNIQKHLYWSSNSVFIYLFIRNFSDTLLDQQACEVFVYALRWTMQWFNLNAKLSLC